MRQIGKALAFLAALLPSLAAAQTQLPTLPANTVLGRLGVNSGPAQAIPLSQLGPTLITSNLAVSAPLSISGLTLSITGVAGKVLAGATPAFTNTPTLGVASSLSGTLTMANSANSGTITLGAASTATSWTFKFPTTAGSNGQALITDGSGNTSWAAGAGTVNSGTAGQLTYYATTAAAVSGNANLNVSAGALTIGLAGSVVGTACLANATSGSVCLSPTTGALGSAVATLSAGTYTVVGDTLSQTLTNKTLTSPTINTPTIAGGTHTAITGLGIRDTTGAFDVTIAATSTSSSLSAGRALTLDMGNVAHTIQFGTTANTITFPSVASDTVAMLAASQTITNKTFTSSTYNGNTFTTGTGILTIAAAKTLTASNTLTLAGTDGTTITFQATDTYVGRTTTDTLTNKTLTSPTINGGTATALTSLGIRSTGSGAFDLTLANTENLSAGRTLTLTLNNAARTINLSGNLTLAGAFATAGGSGITLTASGTTNVTLPTTGTLATIDTSQTFSGTNIFSALTQFSDIKLSSGKIYPTADGTTALQVTKADGTTRIVNFDTTNARVGINKTAGAYDLDVNGAVNVGSTLTFLTLDATSLGTSTSTITGLTVNNSPNSSNDYLLYYNAADGRIRKATVGSIAAGATAGVSSLNGLTGGLSIAAAGGVNVTAASTTVTISGPPVRPQGRLTLASATPVMTSSQSAKTTLYYTPYLGNYIVVYDGTNMVPTVFTELSIATTDATKNPAAIGASKVNDWFVWNDSGTIRLSHGPDWTNDTTRSAGTALVMTNGILLNNASITNGPAASRGTYVGTTRSNSSSQLNWVFGAIGANGTEALLNVWNAYNRVHVQTLVGDTTDSWSWTTAAFHSVNASNTMRVSFVTGLQEDFFKADYSGAGLATGANAAVGIGFDSTTVKSGSTGVLGAGVVATPFSSYTDSALGAHFVQAIEFGVAGGATFYGDAGVTYFQNGLIFGMRM